MLGVFGLFLIRKETFNGLLKVINSDIQIFLGGRIGSQGSKPKILRLLL